VILLDTRLLADSTFIRPTHAWIKARLITSRCALLTGSTEMGYFLAYLALIDSPEQSFDVEIPYCSHFTNSFIVQFYSC
jgi:hypothetical protein